ncbi:MAG: ABC transporter ATP-binding protein [Sandaracinaceae bacterium]
MTAATTPSGAEEVVLRVRDLRKTFRLGLFRRRVEAVRGVDVEVRRGEIFGLLGPNGAGKTTTIKAVLRLIFPTGGTIELFGVPNPGPEVFHRVGYLPENPYVYQYLRPLELLELCGRLSGLDGATLRARGPDLIERVGLGHAMDRPIGKFSKGMMQRIGLAQALLHRPELLVLDEPMSGLDPIGRKEVRDLILEERRRGTTILFTSHILSDVERLCDRVAILHGGRVRHAGRLDELLGARNARAEIELHDVAPELRRALEQRALQVVEVEDHLAVTVDQDRVDETVALALEAGARLRAVTPSRETLEALFVREAIETPDEGRP